MKIYTKTGDGGKSSTIEKKNISKSDDVFDVLGVLDELSANLGLLHKSRITEVTKYVEDIQSDLFRLGAMIAGGENDVIDYFINRTEVFEKEIDKLSENLLPLKNFILPGGSSVSARLHLCRAVSRRVERELVEYYKKNKGLSEKESVLQYVNRLSDLLFTLARYSNYKLGVKDQVWKK